MPDINKLTEQLELECYNYPPDLKKLKKLVDMGADVNAVYNDYQTLLGHILHEYIERVVTLNYTKDLQMGTALICDTLCRGELINGHDGRYLYSIVRFFFENGFDMKKKFMCEGKETLYANDILTELENAFHGPEAIKTLKYILSFVESPDELYDTGGWPISLEYSSNGCFEYFDMDLPRYGCCEYKAARIVGRFIAKKKDGKKNLKLLDIVFCLMKRRVLENNTKQGGAVMSNHDDFLDEYIEYRIFEESMKESRDKPSKHGKRGSGCGTTAIIIVLVIIVLCVFGSCESKKPKSSSSGSYKRSYSTSSYSSTAKSSGSGKSSYSSKSKTESSTVQPTTKKASYKSYSSKSKSSKAKDEFSAKDYADADDFYYDHYDDFYDYEDAEDYWKEYKDD